MPKDKEVTFTEANGYYTTTWTLTLLDTSTSSSGARKTVTLTDDAELAVNNHLDPVASTGSRAAVKPFAVMLAMSLLLLAGAGVPGRRERRRRKHEA